MPKAFALPSVEGCRLVNTVADTLFYNVGALVAELAERDLEVATMPRRANGYRKSFPPAWSVWTR